MTPEQIIAMAREAGIKASVGKTDAQGNYHADKNALFSSIPIEWLTRFATLVAAHEQEECAKFCESNQVWVGRGTRGFSDFDLALDGSEGVHQGIDYAKALRARGQA
jgi:hypothetical protein